MFSPSEFMIIPFDDWVNVLVRDWIVPNFRPLFRALQVPVSMVLAWLDTLFNALVRWLAPVLTFTTEEVWQTRWPSDTDSVHFAEWPEVDAAWLDPALGAKWDSLRALRSQVTEAIEPLRREKVIGSSLEAEVTVPGAAEADLEELFIVAKVSPGDGIAVTRTDNGKCGRCWRHRPEVPEDGGLCGRCAEVVGG